MQPIEQDRQAWTAELEQLHRLRGALLFASVGSCMAIREQMTAIERRIGLSSRVGEMKRPR